MSARHFVLWIVSLLFCLSLSAQTRVVRGMVTDESGSPLAGVKITALTGEETLSGSDGRFFLTVSFQCRFLSFSFPYYLDASAEVDGSFILVRMKYDKEAKAREDQKAREAEEQARREAEARALEEERLRKSEEEAKAASTLSWPSTVSSSSSNGTIAYATAHPTTFITRNSSNYDWYYTGSSSTDNTRWQSSKTIYDPCPPGWRVPDGDYNGVWSKAVGDDNSFKRTYDSVNKGMNFSGKFGSASTIWYPAAGYRYYVDGSLHNVGYYGHWWSCTPIDYLAYDLFLYLGINGDVYPSGGDDRAVGQSVRCLQE